MMRTYLRSIEVKLYGRWQNASTSVIDDGGLLRDAFISYNIEPKPVDDVEDRTKQMFESHVGKEYCKQYFALTLEEWQTIILNAKRKFRDIVKQQSTNDRLDDIYAAVTGKGREKREDYEYEYPWSDINELGVEGPFDDKFYTWLDSYDSLIAELYRLINKERALDGPNTKFNPDEVRAVYVEYCG